MDDHMLDRINEEIKLCFMFAIFESENGIDVKSTSNYKCAAALISTYNKIVKLYYSEQYVKSSLKGSTSSEFKLYLENN